MSIEASQLLLLLNWMSPAFPTGQFAYSHGLEWAVDQRIVTDRASLETWIGDLLTRGSGWNDAVLFARCWDDDAADLNALAQALASSRERYLETTQLGRAFAIAAAAFLDRHPHASPNDPRRSGLKSGPRGAMGCRNTSGNDNTSEIEIAYPIAAGSACAATGIERALALLAYLQGFCAALTSVAVRLVPIGQTAGLEALRGLMPVITATAERAAGATLDDLGAITILSDVAAMKHETQYSRVFRS